MQNEFIRLGNIIFRIDEIKAISMRLSSTDVVDQWYNAAANRVEYDEITIPPTIKINKNIELHYESDEEMLKDYEKASKVLCDETYDVEKSKALDEEAAMDFYRRNMIVNVSK